MQAQVRRPSVDIYLDGKSGGLPGFPDPEELAKRYDVEEEAGFKAEASQKGFSEEQILQQMEFAHKQQALLHKVEAKNMEVERLCVLLEALEPVPGMDAAKYKRLIDNPDNDEHVDVRDSKIVALAKKSRKLQMLLTKERSVVQSQALDIDELKAANEKLCKELENLSLAHKSAASSGSRTIRAPVAHFDSPTKGSAAPGGPDPAELESANTQLRKELGAANKTVEELRRKVAKATDDAKSLSQALAREVGDGVALEQAVDGGWRGRAQQIIMLKSKVKRLEAAAGMNATGMGTLQTLNTNYTSGTGRSQRGMDVDSQAESGLAEMSNERKIAVDALVEERARLIDEYQKLEAKSQGQKARIRKMEEDSHTHRSQLKIVLDKSETDDQLIGALRREVTRLQQASSIASRKDDADMAVKVRQAGAVAVTAAEGEITRLKRQIVQQAAQLESQNQRIRELQSMRR